MKGNMIALDHLGDAEASVLVKDGQLWDVFVADDLPAPGTIYRARVGRPVKGMGGVFVDTPDGSGFLRNVKGLSPGDVILVQVTGRAEPGKAIPLTAKILFKSRYVIVTPDAPGINVSRSIRDEATRDRLLEVAHDCMSGNTSGLILRSSCEGADAADVEDDITQMIAMAGKIADETGADSTEKLLDGDGPHALAWREWTGTADVYNNAGCFETLGILDLLETARRAKAPLTGGGAAFIEPTRALVAVDINPGPDTTPAASLKVNIAAAKDLPRQLRTRGLGGQITLDLAPLPKKDRKHIETALRTAFRADTVETALVGWTPLGHYELQRKRDRAALTEVWK